MAEPLHSADKPSARARCPRCGGFFARHEKWCPEVNEFTRYCAVIIHNAAALSGYDRSFLKAMEIAWRDED
jgi:hypothetical protein